MKRAILLLPVLAVMALAASASAANIIPWEGHGSENLPCTNGGYWVLAPAFGITSATVTVNEVDYVMHQNGEGSWAAESSGTVTADTVAYVSFTGAGDERNHLQLSHCRTTSPSPSPSETESPSPSPSESESESPSPTETESPSPTETESPSPTETESPSPSETESPTVSVSVLPTTHTPGPNSGTPSPTAFTGVVDTALPYAGAALLLALLGTYLLRYTSRKKL